MHDATFWQPLALAEVAPQGVGGVPADVQSFVGAQWGHVTTFAAGVASLHVAPQQLGDPSSAAFKDAALGVLRATAAAHTPVDSSPLAWNAVARSHASGVLADDVRLYRLLNGALNDAAVAAWRVKRADQAPRPISMIRYLAFQGQSSDPKAAGYSVDGLPLVAGLTRLVHGSVEVRSAGAWVAGAAWSPPEATPPSPGGVAEAAAFAYAADTVLSALTGRSFEAQAAAASAAALTGGIDTPGDLVAGRQIGTAVGRLALAAARR